MIEHEWTRSTKCESSACAEVALSGRDGVATIAVRNTRVPGEVVWFDRDEWQAFIDAVKAGEFDL